MTLLFGKDANGNQVPLLVSANGTVQTSGLWSGTSSQLTAGDGSAVNVGSGLTLAGGTLTASGGGWQTTYEVDFTTLTPVASYSNGTATIDGKTWTFSDLNANKTASLSATNGLELVAGIGSGNFRATTNLFDLGLTPFYSQGLIWARTDNILATSGSGESSVDIWTGIDSSNTSCPFLRQMWNSGPGNGGVSGTAFYLLAQLNSTLYPTGGFYSAYTTSNSNHDVVVLQMVTSNFGQVWTGTWTSGWPSFSSLQFRGFIMINAAAESGGVSLTMPNPNAWLFGFRCGSFTSPNTTTTARLKNLRVQVK